jgi:CheY-like chemotaxis protein
MKSFMQGKGLAAPDPKPSPSVNMANLMRLSVLIGETDPDRSREIAELLRELGVGYVEQVDALAPLLVALKKQAFDVLICAEQLGGEDGVSVLRAARKVAPATRNVLMRKNDRAGEFVPGDIEAMELPFSRLTLQGLLHRTASAQGGLWCEVPELSLSDILQMYHQARRSITVLLSGPIAGRIRIEAGEIVHAESNNERGMPALSRLLEAESGLVRTEPPPADGPRTIAAPFQSVILEAAHRLDERRRDSMSGAQPSAAPYTASSYPPPPDFGEHDMLHEERTSVSSGVLRPAMTPMLQAVEPNPNSFLVPNRRARRQTVIAVVSVLASLLFVGVAALYLKDRLDISPSGSTSHGQPEGTAPDVEPPTDTAVEPAAERAGTSGGNQQAPSGRELLGLGVVRPQIANEPSADPELTAAVPSRAVPSRAVPARGVPSHPAPSSPASRPGSFELRITSKPSRATVTEGGRVLGKTPLALNIAVSSVASEPREFMLHLPGYVSTRISQAASLSNVNAAVVLYPRSALFESPDAGAPPFDLEPARPGSPRSKKNELGIRMRR